MCQLEFASNAAREAFLYCCTENIKIRSSRQLRNNRFSIISYRSHLRFLNFTFLQFEHKWREHLKVSDMATFQNEISHTCRTLTFHLQQFSCYPLILPTTMCYNDCDRTCHITRNITIGSNPVKPSTFLSLLCSWVSCKHRLWEDHFFKDCIM